MNIDDKVKLISHKAIGNETREWTREDGLEIGKVYKIKEITIEDGYQRIRIYGKIFSYIANHFELQEN